MPVANTLRAFLDDRGAEYELVVHVPAGTSSETAEVAHVPGDKLAKAVLVGDGRHRTLIVVPATRQVHLGELRQELGDTCSLATEDELQEVFKDCDVGSVPPFGQAYGLPVLLDDSLLEHDRVFAESGDRGALVALPGDDFRRLMKDARPGRYGHEP